MARNERTGNRKTREQRNKIRVPELGYYLIVTDTEATERCYFKGLRESWTCCSEFGIVYENRTGQKYSKSNSDMYSRICKNGDEEKAIRIAQLKLEQCVRDGKVRPSEMWPCTTVHELVGEIQSKTIKTKA